MTKRQMTIVLAAFVAGLAIGFAPMLLIGAGVKEDAAGASGEAGAGESTSVPTGGPALGDDPDGGDDVAGEPVEVPRVGGSGSDSGSDSGSQVEVPQAGAATEIDTDGVCESPTVTVSSGADLQAALDDAGPGDVILMKDGTYRGEMVATSSGTADEPIALCGSAAAVITGEGFSDGYGFHLDGASYWRLIGFTVTNFQKGVMADGTVGSVIEGLTVHGIGDEAIHLRRASTDNTVSSNTVYNTGNRREKFGEGVYVGSAKSNWCDISECEPDRSDRNTVVGNTIYDTTAEAVDIKEGTTGGVLRGNGFDGSSLVEDDADSWVDVKGNDWLIVDNTGTSSPNDGFQTHEILNGWGTGNVFRDNTATVDGDGFGFSLTPERDNVVECSNTVKDAREGFANVECA